ncbi:MAG: AgmX/PglI C-terminal domain-containing protein [Kofleriaceae bacterium]|nr:AgmX/PglI C-terminal domain-containing protein [Kofleriaceae bacterium]
MLPRARHHAVRLALVATGGLAASVAATACDLRSPPASAGHDKPGATAATGAGTASGTAAAAADQPATPPAAPPTGQPAAPPTGQPATPPAAPPTGQPAADRPPPGPPGEPTAPDTVVTHDDFGPRGVTTFGAPVVAGGMDPSLAMRFVRRAQPQLEACYLTALKSNPKLAGTVEVTFIVNPIGRVTQAEGTGVDASVATCVSDVVKKIQFPSLEGQIAKVLVPITYKPPT